MRNLTLIRESGRTLGIAVVGVLVGAVLDHWELGLVIALGVLLLWHLHQWYMLQRWRDTEAAHIPNHLSSFWRDWAQQLDQQRRESQHEAQIRKRLQRQFDALLLALPDAAVAVDSEFRIQWFNESAADLLDLQTDDRQRELSHVMRLPELLNYLRSGDYSLPYTVESFAGLSHPISVQVSIFGARDRYRLITFRDLTQELRVSRLRQEFVANVSHEIKSPLTVVSGYLEMLGEQPEQPPDLNIVREMARQCQRMRRLVDDLLELSRLEASELRDRDMQNVNLMSMASEIRREAQGISSEAIHEILTHGQPDIYVRGRPEELHSALFNLVSNALRYSPEGGKIVISWKHKNKQIRLSVSDEGVGIPPDQIARLAERFYRVDKARSRSTGGTGLGLAIVKHILQRHGGRLQIESTLGKGSTFTCVLPEIEKVRARR